MLNFSAPVFAAPQAVQKCLITKFETGMSGRVARKMTVSPRALVPGRCDSHDGEGGEARYGIIVAVGCRIRARRVVSEIRKGREIVIRTEGKRVCTSVNVGRMLSLRRVSVAGRS